MSPAGWQMLITVAVSTVVGGSAALLLARGWWGGRREESLPPFTPPPPPPPPPVPSAPPPSQEELRRRREAEQRQREAAQRAKDEADLAALKDAFRDSMFETLASNIQFTKQSVLVGKRKTGERALGVLTEESLVPADTFDVRPLRDIGELHMALPSEMALDDDVFDARLAAGEIMISVPHQSIPLMEDVHEPIYKDVIHKVYVLLDISPSMYPGTGEAWRYPIWRGLALKLLMSAQASEAPFTLRPFSGQPHDSMAAITPEQVLQVGRAIFNMKKGSDTDIAAALHVAVKDFSKEEYDRADIMIITDGENNNDLDPAKIRAALDTQRIRLHAVMLGVKNEALRACCDSYQIVEHADGKIKLHPVVKRGS